MSLSAQIQDKVDFIHAQAEILPLPIEKEIKGYVTYTFNVLGKVDSVFLDAKNMKFSEVELNGKKVNYSNDGKTITIHKKFKAGKQYKLLLSYDTKPKQTVYFVGWKDPEKSSSQIWTQGQGKYTSHWLPSFDDMTEKVEFDICYIVEDPYEVVANGISQAKLSIYNNKQCFDMQHPMSSYLLAFVIGNFDKKNITSTSGIPIELYYEPQDSLKVEPTYRYSQQIFDFLEEEIGIPYPWQNYKQIPVKDFLYAGMENTTATIFADSYVIDSIGFVDKNYVNVNAHELAHQWFGDLVTEVSSEHHWLHEGFATYYAYLAEKEIFGKDYYYWGLWETAQQLDKMSREEKGEALTNPKASSLTFYEKGAWALHMLKEEVGEKAFKIGTKRYLEKYSFKNVVIEDFLKEIRMTSGTDLTNFEKEWLNGTQFPFEKAKQALKESNESLSVFFDLQWELTSSIENNETIIKRYWEKAKSTFLKEAIVTNYHSSLSLDFIKEIFKENDLKVRQALVLEIDNVPSELKTEFESLLKDESYLTNEKALYKLWVYFPEDRAKYLDETKNITGLPNKNIRLLWLTLAILTKDYDDAQKQDYFNELSNYTSPQYNFEIRQTVFQYLRDVFGYTNENLKDLVNACMHHSWQFKKFARTLLDELLKDEALKERFLLLSVEVDGEEQEFLNKKLNL